MTLVRTSTAQYRLLKRFASEVATSSGKSGVVAFALVLIGTALEGVGVLLLVPVLSVIFSARESSGLIGNAAGILLDYLPASTALARLLALLALICGLVAARTFMLVKRDVLLTLLQARFVNDKRTQIMNLLANSDWETLKRLRHARIIHVLGSDIHSLRSSAHFLIQGAVSLILLSGQCLIAFLISPILAALIFALLAASFFMIRPMLARARELGAETTESNISLANNTSEFLGGLKISFSQGSQHAFVRAFQRESDIALSREVSFAKQRTMAQAMVVTTATVVGVVTLLVSVSWLHISAAALLTFLVIVARMTGPVMQLQRGMQELFHSLPAYAHLQNLSAALAGSGSMARAQVTQTGAAEPQPVQFRRVTFQHDDASEPILKDLSLQIEPGAFVGITGASGAGKSTFADLVVGLLRPQSGEVRVGGAPLEGALLNAWKASLSYVVQEPFLHHTTIRENLLWANADASDADIDAALRLVGAEELLARLPSGLSTIVGERGGLLSGGERQRIALARGLIRKPALLVLDEATNAIDVQSELAILERLAQLPSRPTILMIAHRESSLSMCDLIVQLDRSEAADASPPLVPATS